MRISSKVGISFFITFILVISLGAISIYSLRHIYKGLSHVFARDLPSFRQAYKISVSMEDALSELNSFLITTNENFKTDYDRAYETLQKEIKVLQRGISEDEERGLLGRAEKLSSEINTLSNGIFEDKIESKRLFNRLRQIIDKAKKKLDAVFDFEEEKMLNEKDFLFIQTQYIPASGVLQQALLSFSGVIEGITRYIITGAEDEPVSFMENLMQFETSIKDYKDYYGYSLSDKERALAASLTVVSSEMREIIGAIVGTKSKIDKEIDGLLVKEKDFMDVMDKLVIFEQKAISAKLGVNAALMEDIPAISNISKIEKDIAESWRMSARYVLTNNEPYKQVYYLLRQNINKSIADYERHARLKGTVGLLNDIVEVDNDILETIDINIKVSEEQNSGISTLFSLRQELGQVIKEALGHNDSQVKEAKDPENILKKVIPARWAIMRLNDDISMAHGLIMSYLNEESIQYKDMYSELYFNMKKHLNNYRVAAFSDKDTEFVKTIEGLLDSFNLSALDIIDNRDNVIKTNGWTLVNLEDKLRGHIDKAFEFEIDQIEKNKKDIEKGIAVINTVIFIIMGIVACIAVFVVFYITKSITTPIQKLYAGAEIIGGGDLDYRLNIKTGDEIEDLADGFNRMAGELKDLYTGLENKVRERTAQLADVNKALAVKNKELDDFTYIVSHDLKEPLRGVKAFTKLLVEDYGSKLDKEAQEYLKTISESSIRMTSLIEDLLNLSKIGRIKNVSPDVDLNELLMDVRKNLAYSLEEKNADVEIAQGFPKVTCDKTRISEVFSNLLSNGIKYSKKDIKPVIEVGYSEEGEFYKFYVKDNGIGIERQYYDRIFQIFQRLHAKDGEYEGTGAGLAIVKKIVENHNGKIWVESEPGEGSTFYFTLPKSSS